MLVSSASDLQANIVKVLSSGGPPLTASKIAKALPVGGRPSRDSLQILLAQLTEHGVLARIPGRTDKFVAMPVETWARAALIEAMKKNGPQTASRLAKHLTLPYAHLAGSLLDELHKDGRIHRHPPTTRSGHPAYGLIPPDPLPYLKKKLAALLAAVEAKGFPAVAVRAAVLRHLGAAAAPAPTVPAAEHPAPTHTPTAATATPAPAPTAATATPAPAPTAATATPAPAPTPTPTPGVVPAPPAGSGAPTLEAIVRAMSQVEPRVHDGAAVSIARLREMFAPRHDKKSFDDAVLLLAKRGIVELQSHAWPARLTAEQQHQLIDNGRGGWFDSAALQRRGS